VDFFEGPVSVRAVGGVGDLEQVFAGQGAPDLAGDAEATHAGIEDADGPPRPLHLRPLWQETKPVEARRAQWKSALEALKDYLTC